MNEKRLLRTVLYLHHKLERASRSFDLSISQYRMLYFLSYGPRRAAELALESSIRKPSITSIVGTLETKGFITREEDPGDRRALCIRITDEGKAVMRAFESHLEDSLQDYLGAVTLSDANEQITPLFEVWNEKRRDKLAVWLSESPSESVSSKLE